MARMRLLRNIVLVIGWLVAVSLSPGPVLGQTHAIEHRLVSHSSSSGPLASVAAEQAVVYSAVVQDPEAEWLRLTFRRVELGLGSYLRLTSLEDGAVQHLHPIHLQQWQSTSAYFNGPAVLLELVAGPGTTGNVVEVGDLYAGTVPAVPRTQCGPADNRVPSDEPERARLLDIGCTAWLYNEESCFASAGHCVANAGLLDIVEFNVPPSNPNGSINHPGPEDQYAVDTSEVPFTNGGQGNDWGLFRVFPNSETGLLPFQVQGAFLEIGGVSPPFDDRINIVGYGVDSGTSNQTQQISFGPVTQSSSNLLRYRADTQGGNSGSGVVWEQTGEAVAIHTHGGCSVSGGSNAGTAVTHPGLQAALASFCQPGGGGVPCSEIHNFPAFCRGTAPNNFLLTGVLLNSTTYSGESVTFTVDGEEHDVTIVGQRAVLELLGATTGAHQIELTEPAGCAPPRTVICQ